MIIVDVDDIDIIKSVPDPIDVSIIDVKGNPENPEFVYRVPLTIDLREALKNNISTFAIKVLNKSFNSTVSAGFVSMNSDVSPMTLNHQLSTFSEKNRIKYLNTQAQSIVSETKSDFKDILNDQVMSRFDHLTDEELFGTAQTLVIDEMNSTNADFTDLTTPLNDPYANESLMTVSQAIDCLYQEGGDPASAFAPVQDELSYSQSKQGLTIDDYSKLKKKTSRVERLKNTIRTSLVENSNIPFVSGEDKLKQGNIGNASRFKTYELNQSLREQEIYIDITVDQETISKTGGKVYLAITAYNMFGLIVDIRSLTLDHSSFTSNLSVFLPNLKVAATRSGVNRDIITLSLTNDSLVEISAKAYYKVTYECGSLDLMRFVNSAEYTIPSRSTKTIKYTALDSEGEAQGPATKGSVLFRVVPSIKSYEDGGFKRIGNTYFASLKSKVLERNMFIPMVCFNNKDNVGIEFSSIPSNIKTLSVVKRNISKHEREFTPIKNEIGSEVMKVNLSSNDKEISFYDFEVKDEVSYEYKAVVEYGAGESYMTINSGIIEYLKPDSSIVLDATELTAGEGISVNVTKEATPADRIFSQLSSFAKKPQGIESSSTSATAFELFKNDMEQIKSTVQDAVLLRVIRHNQVSGESLNLGEFNVAFNTDSSTNGTTLIEDPFGKDLETSYIYEIRPFIRPVFDILVDIRSRLKQIARQSNRPSRNLVLQLVQSVEKEIISITGNKFYTRDVYNKGTVQDSQQYVEQVNGDILSYGRNGNIAYLESKTEEIDVEILKPRVTIIKAVEGLLEAYDAVSTISVQEIKTWFGAGTGRYSLVPKRVSRRKNVASQYTSNIVQINFEYDGDPTVIDYFVITCLKRGAQRVVGALHCPDSPIYQFTYIDDSQIDYQGAVSYSLYAVLENKRFLGPYNIGTAIIGVGT